MPNNVDHNQVVSMNDTNGIGVFEADGSGQHFQLSFAGCPLCRNTLTLETGIIDWTANTGEQGSNTNSLQYQLNTLANIANSGSDQGSLGVRVSRSNIDAATNEGYIFTVTFQGTYVPGNVPLLVASSNSLGGVSTSDGSISIDIAVVTEGYTPGFKLVYSGQTTGCIAWNEAGDINKVGVAARLEALTNIADITSVQKTEMPSEYGYAYTIVFGTPSEPVSIEIPDTITGCDNMPNNVDHNQVVSMNDTNGIGTGLFRIRMFCGSLCSWGIPGVSSTNFTFDAFESNMNGANSLERKLNAIVGVSGQDSSIGVSVTRSTYSISNNEGFVFTITFSGHRYSGNIPLLSLDAKPAAVSTTDESDGSSIQVTFVATTEGRTGGFRLRYTWQTTSTSYCIGFDAKATDATYNSIYDATVEKRIELMIQNYHQVTVVKDATASGHRYTIMFDYPTGLNPRALVMIQSDPTCDAFVATPNFVIDKDGDGLGDYPTNYFRLSYDTSSSTFGNESFCALCTLGKGKYVTDKINWEATIMSDAASIQSRLNELPNLGDVIVAKSGPTINDEGYVFSITFGSSGDASSTSLGNVPLLQLHEDNLGGISTSDFTLSSERFVIYTAVTGKYPAYRVIYENVYSDCIPYDAAGSGYTNALQNTLIQMSTISNVTVTRSDNLDAYKYTITFVEPATPVSLSTDYPSSYCSNFEPGIWSCNGQYTNCGENTHIVDPYNLQGTFIISFNTTSGASTGNCSLCTYKNITDSTTNIYFNDAFYDDVNASTYLNSLADPSALKEQLENLTNIGNDNLTVSITSPWNHNASSIYEGFTWSITFNGVSVQGDIPLLAVEEESITGDELGLISTEINIEEKTKGNHAGFKIKFRDQLSYCIGWDSPNSEYEYGDFRSWEKNIAVSPMLSTYISNAVVNKDEESLYWVLKYDDLTYNRGDLRRKKHDFVPQIILDSECDHARGGTLTYTVSPIGLSGNLSRIDLVSPLSESEVLSVGDKLIVSTNFSAPAAENKKVVVVEVINATRIVIDPPLKLYSNTPFTIKRKIPPQRAIIVKKPCGKNSMKCDVLKYSMNKKLTPVSNVTLRNIHAGSKENIECSGRGTCDRNTGLCKCFYGYVKDDCSSLCTPDPATGNCQNEVVGI